MHHNYDLAELQAAPVNGSALTAARAAYDAEVAANGQTPAAATLAKAVFNKIGLCLEELEIANSALISRLKKIGG